MLYLSDIQVVTNAGFLGKESWSLQAGKSGFKVTKPVV